MGILEPKPVKNNKSLSLEGACESEEEEEIVCTHLCPSSLPKPSPSANEPDVGIETAETVGVPPSANESNVGTETAKTLLVAGTAGVGVPTIATAGLGAAGFGSSGIIGGSIAAGIQAGIGNVAAGSAFATLQSIGATGGFAILGPLGIGAALLSGGIYASYRVAKHLKSKQNEKIKTAQNGKRGDMDTGDGKKMNQKLEIGKEESCKNTKPQVYLRGINICNECWEKLQRRQYLNCMRKQLSL